MTDKTALRPHVEDVFIALDKLIQSGQVPAYVVPAIVDAVPGFAAWRAMR